MGVGWTQRQEVLASPPSIPPLNTPPTPQRCKEVRICNTNKEGRVASTGTLKHIYLQSLRLPQASTQAAPVFAIPMRSLLAFSSKATSPGLVSNSLSENWASVSLLSSLAGQSHMRTEPFQVLPHTVCAWPGAHIHRCSVTGCGQQRTGPILCPGRPEMPQTCPGQAFVESDFQNKGSLATTRN